MWLHGTFELDALDCSCEKLSSLATIYIIQGMHAACNANKVGAVKVCIAMRLFDQTPLFLNFLHNNRDHRGTL